ncbi:MAG: hypothetical protein QG608_2699 [Actinomycetota bacterium]|nr:hypothetical protein [Actinomycetota bacterium]
MCRRVPSSPCSPAHHVPVQHVPVQHGSTQHGPAHHVPARHGPVLRTGGRRSSGRARLLRAGLALLLSPLVALSGVEAAGALLRTVSPIAQRVSGGLTDSPPTPAPLPDSASAGAVPGAGGGRPTPALARLPPGPRSTGPRSTGKEPGGVLPLAGSATRDRQAQGRPVRDGTVRAGTVRDGTVRDGSVAVWPLDPVPRVIRRFSVGPFPWSPGHRGADLVAHDGQSVRAALAGIVSFSGRVVDRSVVSVLHPDGLRTTYGPLSPAVVRGQRVEQGEVLGTVAPGHCAVESCLHWGALRGESYLDPLSLLKALGRPVLLPLLRGSADLGEFRPQLEDGLGVHLADP